MKKVLLILLLCSTFFGHSQKTLQFSDPQPVGSVYENTVDNVHFGEYKNKQTHAKYVIDEQGISIETTLVSYITREQLRESSKLQVRGNYLFGIKDNDSVPCVLDGEKYYYGIVSKLTVIGNGSLNKLVRLTSNTYILNFHEGMYFEPSLLTFVNGELIIVHADLAYKSVFDGILQVNTITRYGSEVVVLAPASDQWSLIQKYAFEGEKLIYIKE